MSRSKGFSLVELAVALAIIALLLAGALIPLSTQIDVRNGADTQRSMESIREAIIGFAQANGRLPCPADGSLPAGAAGAGTEQVSGNSCTATNSAACTAVNGAIPCSVVPWATLGVPETDAWGRRFTYRVSPAFADAVILTTWNTRVNAYSPPAGNLAQTVSSPTSPANQAPTCDLTVAPNSSSFALCTLGDIAVFTRGGTTTTAAPLGTALPAVIISHGKNGFGAWQTNGTRLNPIPTGNDEAANSNGNTTAIPSGGYASWAFYSRTRTPEAAGCVDPVFPATSAAPACEFDDIVIMISSSALITRMVSAGRLP
jgi:prepilin-type N-terminal cleavage/methylation domain-containing protein